jgi:hypothetical protein
MKYHSDGFVKNTENMPIPIVEPGKLHFLQLGSLQIVQLEIRLQ